MKRIKNPKKKGLMTNTVHGLKTLKRAVKVLGSRAIDPRTKTGRALRQFKADIVADLGGSESLSAQQLELVDVIVATKLVHDSITAWLLSQPSMVNKRQRALWPVVLQRQTLADSLCRNLERLGLERKAKQVPSIQDYLNQNGSNQP